MTTPPRPDTRGPDPQVDDLGQAMQDYQRSVRSFEDTVARRLEVGPADLRCLDRLADGPATAGGLSEATGLRPAATTALVDRLVRRGLVRRTRPDGDRRTVVVELTELGQRSLWEAYGPLMRATQAVLEALTPEQRAHVVDHLRRLTGLTEQHRAELAAGHSPSVSPGRAPGER